MIVESTPLANGTPRFVSVREAVDLKIWPGTEGSLRWQLFRRAENGLDRAVRRVGHKLVLSVTDLNDWLNDQRETNAASV